MADRTYRFDREPLNTHMLLLEHVPAQARVLEIGTASGYLGEYLVHEKHCDVWGVEPVKELYEDALHVGYEKIFHQTAEETLENIEIKEQKFDIILIGDVLEHMVDPGKVLSELKRFLKPEGKFVISLPNVAHYTVRFGLLKGDWNMTDSGILDKTHLRFFTRATAIELLIKAGLSIEVIRPSSGYIERRWKACFSLGKRILFWWPELLAVQFVFVAKLPR